MGDGGFITTNNKSIYEKIKTFRNHGKIDTYNVSHFGMVSRMDELQAAILNFRLEKLDSITKKRRDNAKRYIDEKHNVKSVFDIIKNI